ncbi:MAG TPA: S46 family peptidase [Polyangiales bacterium]|jgi:hypothetical protein
MRTHALSWLWISIVLSPTLTHADEGMWLPNAVPAQQIGKKYGFTPDQAWLDNVRLSSVRLAQGCSGSFVSAQGLVMTNHHCAHACIEQLSSAQKDYVENGFYAPSEKQEPRCPAIEVNQLISIQDVSKDMSSATANKVGAAFSDAKKAAEAKLEKACATSDDVRCEVVELYHGARYHLYQYKRYQDVRLVFAPEIAIAFFGGDPDNFNYPRYDLDVAFLRIYSNDKPAKTEHFFPFSANGAQENELVFTSGHPGRTSRELTVSELLFERNIRLPHRIWQMSELRGLLHEFGRRGKEQLRTSSGVLFYVENALKAYKGKLQALLEGDLLDKKKQEELALRKRTASDKRPDVVNSWSTIDAAVKTYSDLFDAHDLVERAHAFPGDLFEIARSLVRSADELPKPNETRLREYSDAALPALKQTLFSPAPIHPDLEAVQLAFGLTKLREMLGADDPIVHEVLGKKSPATLANELVKHTALADVALRKKLFEGGKAAIDASRDPMIVFARRVDADARNLRKRYEDSVESPLNKAHEALATLRFETYGTSVYPDATFTLRLSYGAVRGWQERGKNIPPFTYIRGAFDRATGEDPFALPKRWIAAHDKLALDTPFNFVSTNDIVGGNSGSPVINKNAELVGLIFDGNILSLGGDYGYDERVNRAVSVHSSALLEALRVVYGAGRIADELRAPKQ